MIYPLRLFPLIALALMALGLIAAPPGCSSKQNTKNTEENDYAYVDCDATIAEFSDTCRELQMNWSALHDLVCDQFEDPACLAWCMDHHQACEAMLNCYDQTDCEVEQDDDTQSREIAG